MARGLYRKPLGWGPQDSVRVLYDDDQELDVPADIYVSNGYQPELSQLPTQSEYDDQ